MVKTENDAAYEGGVKDGKEGNFFDDAVRLFAPNFTEKDEIRDKGYDWGHEHRYDDVDSGSESSEKSESCCFITTACLRALNLPEDSLEFKAMKVLTKEHILKSMQGKRDYITYNRIAPAIVGRIESRDDSKKIWSKVYESLSSVAQLVFQERYAEGHSEYKRLVKELEVQV